MEKKMELQECMNLGMDYMASGNFNEAILEFQKAISTDAQNIDIYMHLGNAYASLGQFEAAVKAFKTALMFRENDGKALFSIGSVYYLQNDFASAVKYYNKAEKSGYENTDLFMMKAGIFVESEDYTQAIREISKAIKLNPFRGELYNRKIILQVQAKQTDEAMETLQEYLELMPDSLDAYDMSVQLHCMRKEYQKAETVIKSARELFPDDPVIAFLEIKVYIESEQYDKAKEKAEILLSAGVDGEIERKTVIYLATACAKLGNLFEASEALVRYTEKKKNDEVMYLLMNAYMAENDYEKVKIIAEELKAMECTPSVLGAAKFYYAEALEHTEGMERSAKEYRSLVTELRKMSIQNPGLYEVYIYRLLCHTRLREYDKALELADYLEKTRPDLADGHLYKYHIYKAMGETEKAETEKALVRHINPQINL